MSRPARQLVLIALVALAVRAVLMLLRGDYIVYDEGYYLLLARSLRDSHAFALNGLPHVALSPLQPVLVAGLSLSGLPDLWASRLLAALCGALLVLPVATLALRWFGQRGALGAAVLTATAPALLTFLPFFPGEGWNLYFGSEPVYLLLAVSAVAVAARAAEDGRLRWWVAAGVLASLAYVTRLEGIVLAAGLLATSVVWLVLHRRAVQWPRATAAAVAGALVAAPYLAYLHGALGRWALSGRVQAAVVESAPVSAQPAAGGGTSAVNAFVWGGDVEALWRTLYALDASGTRMASQYWGVTPAAGRLPRTATERGAPLASAAADTSPAREPARPRRAASLARALLVVMPLWMLLLGGYGFTRARARLDATLWLAPLTLAALVPAMLAYAEPRALLPLVPIVALLAAGGVSDLAVRLADRARRPQVVPVAFTVVAAALLAPTARDAARAWSQETPLQQVAAAQRAVGEYLGAHLPADARIVSWHPSLAIWARRDWRVLPYEPFERIMRYARAQGAAVVVFSRFNPSPLREAPRAFTAILTGPGDQPGTASVQLESVYQTPLLFVGRLAQARPSP